MKPILVVLGVMLILLHGCTDAHFGLTFPDDCEHMGDSEKVGCYHQAAVTTAHVSHDSDASARLCHDIMNEVGYRNRNNDIGRRAEIEKNSCLYDIVSITSRYDENAHVHCRRIGNSIASSFFSGSDITQDMCMESYDKKRRLRDTLDGEGLCMMTFGIILLLAMVFSRNRKENRNI